jgi:hypothetical protein
MKKPAQQLIAEVPRRRSKVEIAIGKSKSAMKEKTKNKPLTPVTCSWKTRFSE